MSDPDDNTEAHAREGDPDTAHAAAERMRNSRLEAQVLATLKSYGIWMTSLEVANAMGIDKWSISPRFRPLYRKGLIEEGRKIGLNSNDKPRKLQAWRFKLKTDLFA